MDNILQMYKMQKMKNQVESTLVWGNDGLWRLNAKHHSGKEFKRINRDLSEVMTTFHSWLQGVEG